MLNLEQALLSERLIIGSMLLKDKAVPLALLKLSDDDFYDPVCRNFFRAIRDVFQEGRPIDMIPVLGKLKSGDDYIQWCRETMEITAAPSNIEEYIAEVKRASRRRHILEDAEQLAKADDEQMEVIVRRMVSRLSDVERMPRMTAQARFSDFYERMKRQDKPKYLPWGLPTVDKYTYAEPGDMILLGGYASSGKTLLSIIMAMAQAKAGYKVGYYSLETSAAKMTDRQAASLANIPMSRIKAHDMRDSDWPRLAEACCAGSSECGFPIIQAAGCTVDDITADALANGFNVIYVDYVQQLMVSGIRTDNPRIIVTEVSQRLKRFAQSTKTAVVALAQLSRPDVVYSGKGENKEVKTVPPTMHSFKESGQLEQDADVAFLVWPSKSNDNNSTRVFKIGKNKEGPRKKVELAFYGDIQTMVELDRRPDHSVAAEMSAKGRAAKQANRVQSQQVEFRELRGGDEKNPFEEESEQ